MSLKGKKQRNPATKVHQKFNYRPASSWFSKLRSSCSDMFYILPARQSLCCRFWILFGPIVHNIINKHGSGLVGSWGHGWGHDGAMPCDEAITLFSCSTRLKQIPLVFPTTTRTKQKILPCIQHDNRCLDQVSNPAGCCRSWKRLKINQGMTRAQDWTNSILAN